MVRRRKFLNAFDLFKNKKSAQFNVVVDSIYFMENLYKYSMTKRVFLKRRKHLFFNYKNHCHIKLFGFFYSWIKKQVKTMFLNVSSIILISKIFFSSNQFFFNNKNKLFKKLIIKTNEDFKKINLIEIIVFFQFIKLLSLQKQITTILLKSILFLEKKISYNNGIHYSYKLTRKIPAFFKFKIFHFKPNLKRNKIFKKNNLRSAFSIKLKLSFKNIFKKNIIFCLKFLVQFILNSFSYKILSLFCCSNGVFFYSPSTSLHNLFRFYKNKIYTIRRRYKFRKDTLFLFKLKRLDTFCSFSFSFNIKNQYALAIGAKAKLTKIEKIKNIGIVELPSKAKKIISLYTPVLKGRIKTFSFKKLKITKAGYLRLRGKKANSRGLAMNPVDHPHGGKTGSLKLHRTPWGGVAKLK